MFTPDNIQSRLREKPFTPVRFVTSMGQIYDVYHPDLVLVAERFLMIGTPSRNNPARANDVTRVAIMHVTEMRDLAAPNLPPAVPLQPNASTSFQKLFSTFRGDY
jgi:hypothetical protein